MISHRTRADRSKIGTVRSAREHPYNVGAMIGVYDKRKLTLRGMEPEVGTILTSLEVPWEGAYNPHPTLPYPFRENGRYKRVPEEHRVWVEGEVPKFTIIQLGGEYWKLDIM